MYQTNEDTYMLIRNIYYQYTLQLYIESYMLIPNR